MNPCPTCFRPLATEADEALALPEGSHLCWKEWGGVCEPPEWWSSVTPLEVETLRAEQDRLNRLIASAIANAHTTATRVKPLWVCVRDLFAVGSTTAHELCRAHGYDPDQAVTLHVRAVKRATKESS